MLYSMTAFARTEHQSTLGNLVCEMRSINHRYLEISLYLSEALRTFEMPLRERIRQMIKRGKIECHIRYQPHADQADSLITINTALAKSLCQASEKIATFLAQATPPCAVDILHFPGVIEARETNLNELKQDISHVLDATLTALVAARQREGNELKQFFLERMTLLQEALAKIRAQLPHVIQDQHERLNKRFAEVKLELNPERLEQEMLIFMQKMDVTEEMDRTETHITEVYRILKEGGAAGRRLDFLLQELNREANTLASKSVNATVTHMAVEMKVLIEQVREQVQNLE